jgi:hypothetical protein
MMHLRKWADQSGKVVKKYESEQSIHLLESEVTTVEDFQYQQPKIVYDNKYCMSDTCQSL